MTKDEKKAIDKLSKLVISKLDEIRVGGYYSLIKILETNADYYMIIGERSNGKTTVVLALILLVYILTGYKIQGGLIRRWEEDYKGKNGSQMFEGIINLGWISKWTNGEYNTVTYYSQRWFLSNYDEEGNKVKSDDKPFLLGFSISAEEHYKSTSYPNLKLVLFDEFLSRTAYLPDEFIKFQNLLSTIVRLNDDIRIFMCGNTVNKFCPYFKEMGITNIKTMKKGSIDVYTYGESDLKVAVEFSDFKGKKKKSNKYFAFNNPKLSMIRNGTWEIDIYPHLPYKFKPNELVFTYYIEFNEEKFECQVINKGFDVITFIHRKTTDIIENEYPVYSDKIKPDYNYNTNIYKPRNTVEKVILQQFKDKKIFYQDNEVGETIRNYLLTCLNK